MANDGVSSYSVCIQHLFVELISTFGIVEPPEQVSNLVPVLQIWSNKAKKKKRKEEGESNFRQDGELASHLTSSTDGANSPVSLASIQRLLAGMEERIITSVKAQISSNHTNLTKHDQEIQNIDTAINDFQDRITTLEPTVGYLSKENQQLKLKLEDLEKRFRRCNIWAYQKEKKGLKISLPF